MFAADLAGYRVYVSDSQDFTVCELVDETTAETLAQLKPAFKEDGIVTAGNSSQISDGAAALLMMA